MRLVVHTIAVAEVSDTIALMEGSPVLAVEGTPGVEAKHEMRRLVPRMFADWKGTYRIEDESEDLWRDCRVTDISSAGAGLELSDASLEVTEGRIIVLNLQLKAELRHGHDKSSGFRHVGVRFVDLTEDLNAYLASMEALGARW